MHRHTPGVPKSIGSSTPNNAVYILDAEMRPVPRGMPGIMWAGGRGVCMGYLNRPDLTRDKFLRDPFFMQGGMMYNTGDIGKLQKGGQLIHLGRVDDQVKIKGFRVELDGVTAAVRACPGIESARALLIGQDLWAFYSPICVPTEEIRTTVAALQPYYAVPCKYHALSVMPLTTNGKVDKLRLRSLVTTQPSKP
ncbi:hypothetical protein POSPLADRAFT_1041305 [Postia placenta MAD-698-R-SB12]|uniref:AMP-dependent synthetase/ligase domain-containing protein n=1 Tax=Postia placenta MAD-698-R-SB12 TaxID=670580 RepID=A0A1X6MQU1_9APHY|nr:hypothetical protein POSPLADRAFT_1041305 [Postia placenta MAD-698-R-SB12]OSX58552.1 hypothetical protein POSPLADRAFT_1041305 [Postia placenta MAD-698-R-SB12]